MSCKVQNKERLASFGQCHNQRKPNGREKATIEKGEAIAKDKFGPLIMSCGATSVDFIQTGEMTMSVITKYKDEATGTAAMEKIAEIRGQAATTLPVKMVSDVKGLAFASMCHKKTD